MTKQIYEFDPSKSSEKNICITLCDIANELHDLVIQVSNLGYAVKVLTDGSIREKGAMQEIIEQLSSGFQVIQEHLDER